MLCYSSLGLPDWPIEDQCHLLGRFDYDGIEIAMTPEQFQHRGDADYWKRAGEAARAAGISIVNFHLGNPRLHPQARAEPTLLHRNSDHRRFWIGLVHQAFEIADRLGIEWVTIGSGLPRADLDHDAMWDLLLQSLEEALGGCPSGCTLLVEHEPEHFIRNTDDVLELYRRTGRRVLANVDAGHLEVAGDPIGSSIVRLGAIMRDLHLEDIKDRVHRHLLPGQGDIDFEEIGAALGKIDYKGLVTADLYPYAAAPIGAIQKAHEAFAGFVPARS